jgi:hypothetical protein
VAAFVMKTRHWKQNNTNAVPESTGEEIEKQEIIAQMMSVFLM